MNLLDIFEGREPYQQAIDRLEQRRIEDLEAKMDDYARRGMKDEFQKCKAERDSYYKIKTNEGAMKRQMEADAERMSREQFCNKYGDEHGDFWDNINGPMDEAGIPGNVPTEKIPGKEDLLKGKGRSYYEEGSKEDWSKDSDWKAIPKSKSGKPVDPRGQVTHLSDLARRKAERKAQTQKKILKK